MAREVTLAKSSEIPPGTGMVVEAEGRLLAVFNADGDFYVIDNTCLHRGGPLGEGILDGTVVTCPWHGWEYDIASGQHTLNPAIKVNTYRVNLRDGEVRVEL